MKLFVDTRMLECKAVRTPMIVGPTHTGDDDHELMSKEDVSQYRSRVENLPYITFKTRPDLCVTGSILGTRAESPTSVDMVVVRRALRFLNGTCNYRMRFKPGTNDQVRVYADSDCGFWYDEKKGRTDVLIRFDNGTIFAISKIQKNLSLSSTEDEYNALAESTVTVAWVKNQQRELNFYQPPTGVAQNNSCAIEWAEGRPAKHLTCRKHIDMKGNYAMIIIESEKTFLKKVET